MNTRLFLENFWATEQKNELFVCMPFHDSFDEKFTIIDNVAKQLGFECARRTKENAIGNDVVFEILDGLANSRTLLFDLSIDPKLAKVESQEISKISENVLYELGVALTAREPADIFLISQKTEASRKLPFDILNTQINFYKYALTEDWLKEKLDLVVKQQAWYKSRRIKTAIRLIDSWGLKIINLYSDSKITHFNDENFPVEMKLGILRLIDLGIVLFATGKQGGEYAYYWTGFGKEVIKKIREQG